MKKLWLFLLVSLAFFSSGCAKAPSTEPVEKDAQALTELNEIMSIIDNEDAQQIIKMMIDKSGHINRNNIEVESEKDSFRLYYSEVKPYITDLHSLESGEMILEGCYVCYQFKYIEEYKNGSVEYYILSIYVEVDDKNSLIIPIHAYAYKRCIKKRAGIIEPFTSPDIEFSVILID